MFSKKNGLNEPIIGIGKVNLQLFAEGGEGDDGLEVKDPDKKESEKDTKEPEKTFTLKELEAAKQEAVSKAKADWEKEYREKLKTEKEEAEKLAKLSKEEREKAEFEKQKKEFEKKQNELARKELKIETVTILGQKNLPTEFADILMGQDAESTKANIDLFAKQFNQHVQKAVEDRIAGKTPQGGDVGGGETDTSKMTDEEYFKWRESQKK